MLAIERRNNVLRLIDQLGSVKVSELAAQFGVTEETVRRDLEELEKDGYLKRTYGGAVSNKGTGFELSFLAREERNREEKRKISMAASSLISDGDIIIIDSSTTALWLGRSLKNKRRLTVISNSVTLLMELAQNPEITFISTGGSMRPNFMSFVGPLAERAMSGYHVDRAFISCKGIELEHGLTDSNEMEVEIKKTMIKAAKEIVVLADGSKFGNIAFATIAPLDKVNKIVTDGGAPREIVDKLRSRGIDVIIA